MKLTPWRTALACVATLAVFVGKSAAAPSSFTHPGVMYGPADLARIKSKLTTAPWSTNYNAFKARSTASLSYTMQGPFATVGREPNVNRSQYENDMTAIHDQALMWVMTGNTAYRDKARSILNAWASTHTTYTGSTPALLSGDFGMLAAMGAEIIRRYSGNNWAASEITACENYFRNVVYAEDAEIWGESNQGASRLKSRMALAAFLSDAGRWDTTVNGFRDAYNTTTSDSCVGLGRNSLSTGQEAEAGRDQPHPLGAIGNYASAAEICRSSGGGANLYSYLSQRVLQMSEYWCQYNLGNSVSYSDFGPCSNHWSSISATGRSNAIAWAPVEMIYGNYGSGTYTLQYRNGLQSSSINNAATSLWLFRRN